MMQYLIHNKAEAANIFNYFYSQIKENSIYSLEFDELKKSKTYRQVKYIWAVFKVVSDYLVDLGNDDFEPETVKDWFYERLGLVEQLTGPDGKVFNRHKVSISSMNVLQASDFISRMLILIDNDEVLKSCILPPCLRYCWTLHVTQRQIDYAFKAKLPEKSPEYLAHQAGLSCIRCGRLGVQVHHLKEGAALGKKNDDWFTIPVCPDCHVPYLHSSAGEPNFLQEISPVINNLEIEAFCRLAYIRWLKKY